MPAQGAVRLVSKAMSRQPIPLGVMRSFRGTFTTGMRTTD